MYILMDTQTKMMIATNSQMLICFFREDGYRKIMKIRLTKSPKSCIRDQYFPEKMRCFFENI